MSKDARKREKHRIKRKEKQRAQRKAGALTPFQRCVKSGGRLECYVNANWREQGMANVQILAHAPDGRMAYVAFLVDNWCVGLKDISARPEMPQSEWLRILGMMRDEMPMARIEPAEARRLVAGGIRYARRNGFRLPAHHERWTAILGPLGDIESADLDGFRMDGKLFYMGTMSFLQNRLIGISPNAFLERPDVLWTQRIDGSDAFGLTGEDDEDEEGYDLPDEEDDAAAEDGPSRAAAAMEMADQMLPTLKRAQAGIRKWCFKEGIVAHPRIDEALSLLLISLIPSAKHLELSDAGKNAGAAPDPYATLAELLKAIPPDESADMALALEQVQRWIASSRENGGVLAALGSEEPL